MSQVCCQYITVPLEEDILSAKGHILIAEPIKMSEVFFEKIFPEKTHYLKSGDSAYQEFVDKYQIKEVIKSDKFKKDDVFWVWNKPNYSMSDIKKYHESGFSRSPAILTRSPNYPVNEKETVLFIVISDKKSKKYPETYSVITSEGVESEKEIGKILKGKNGIVFRVTLELHCLKKY